MMNKSVLEYFKYNKSYKLIKEFEPEELFYELENFIELEKDSEKRALKLNKFLESVKVIENTIQEFEEYILKDSVEILKNYNKEVK